MAWQWEEKAGSLYLKKDKMAIWPGHLVEKLQTYFKLNHSYDSNDKTWSPIIFLVSMRKETLSSI